MRNLLLLAAAASLIGFVDASRTPPAASIVPPAGVHVPFRVGERLTYDAHVNFMSAGQASMSVEDITTIRGRPTYHTIFDVIGRVLFFHVDAHSESWFD